MSGTKWRQALVIALGLLVLNSAGCGTGMPTAEPVTIRFVHPEYMTEYYMQAAEKFAEAHPEIIVELGASVRGDTDVFVISPYELGGFWERGDILSLDSFIEQDEAFDLSGFYPGTVELFGSEGKTWALPFGVNTMVMFFNQDLFDAYDAPYPQLGWTWADFLDAALAVRDADANIFGYAPTLQSYGALAFVYAHGGGVFDDLQNPTRTTFDDPLTIEAVEWYAKLINEYDVAPSPNQVRSVFGANPQSVYVGILRSQVGMWMGMLSERGGLSWPVDWPMRWGMIPLPRDAQSISAALVDGLAISAQTQHREAAWAWVSFLTRQMPEGTLPARRSLADSSAYEQLVGRDAAVVARASMDNAVVFSPELIEFGPALEIFEDAVDDVINGLVTPEEAMRRAQREAENRGP